MSNQTTLLDEILYQGQRPWLEKNTLDEKFASKFRTLKEASTDYQFLYEINFIRPFDNKTKYYSKLILNTVKKDVENLYNLISKDDTENLIRYWLNDTLNKRLKTRLKDIGKLIKEKDFQLIYIDPKKDSFEIDQVHKANTFIIQLLKLAYMQLYLEIQDAFNLWIDDKLEIDDFYTQLLLEPVPNIHYLTKIQTIEIETIKAPSKKQVLQPTVNLFHSFTYKQFIKHPDKLTDLCDSLKKNNFICKETQLSNFKKAFSGDEIKTPVIWTGNVSEFYYFIKLLYLKQNLVLDLKQNQWKVACKCFIKPDGTIFDHQGLRKNQAPKSTGHLLESAISLLV